MHISKNPNLLSFDFKCEHDSFDVIKATYGDRNLLEFSFTDHGDCPDYQHVILFPELDYLDKKNSLYLRSDEFIYDHKKNHTVFSGCSQTFGFGIKNTNRIWPMIVYDTLKDQSGFFNLARPGISITEIVSDLKIYCEKYGMPNQIFVLFPDYTREFANYGSKTKDITDAEVKLIRYFQLKTSMNAIFLLEFFAKHNNIKLKYSTWDKATDKEFCKYKLENFFSIFNNEEIEKVWITKRQADGHWAELQHLAFANIVKGL